MSLPERIDSGYEADTWEQCPLTDEQQRSLGVWRLGNTKDGEQWYSYIDGEVIETEVVPDVENEGRSKIQFTQNDIPRQVMLDEYDGAWVIDDIYGAKRWRVGYCGKNDPAFSGIEVKKVEIRREAVHIEPGEVTRCEDIMLTLGQKIGEQAVVPKKDSGQSETVITLRMSLDGRLIVARIFNRYSDPASNPFGGDMVVWGSEKKETKGSGDSGSIDQMAVPIDTRKTTPVATKAIQGAWLAA